MRGSLPAAVGIGEGQGPDPSVSAGGGRTPRRAETHLILVLTLVHILSWIDKNIFALMVIPIKQRFLLSDDQVALFIGTAFAAGTIAAMLPAGYLADRFQRRFVLIAGTWLWSACVIVCALAATYWHLFVARMFVGFGEGLILPAAYSLLRDGVHPGRRARGLSTFAMGQMLGGGLALLLGGLLLALLARHSILPALQPYQETLLLVGFVGIPVGALFFLVAEPARGERASAEPGSYAGTIRHMRSAWKDYLPLALFFIAMNMLSAGFGAWLPTVMARNWDLTPARIGMTYGVMMLILPPMGLWIAGSMLDRLAARSGAGPVGFAMAAAATIALLAAAAPAAPSVAAMWLVIGVLLFFSMMVTPIVPFLVGRIAVPTSYGRVMAIFLIAQNLVANATAPSLTAAMARILFGGGRQALAQSLSVLNLTYGVVATVALIFLFGRFRKRSPVLSRLP